MIKLDYTVKVYAGESGDNANIGLAGGVCTWSTADSTIGVLASDWASTIRRRVDVSLGGNEQKYDYTTVNIYKSAGVETALNNSGLSLIGSMIEVVEVGESVSEILFRGVIESIPENGNNIAIKVSHLSNFYQTQLTTRVGDKNTQLVFGENVIASPVFVESEQIIDETIGNGFIPAFVVYSQEEDNMFLRSVYDSTKVSKNELIEYLDFFGNGKFFIASGENELILKTGSQVTETEIDGKIYYMAKFGIVPLNMKDEGGLPKLPTGSTVVLSEVKYNKFYTPYGCSVDYDNIKVISNGVEKAFPFYVDSIKYYENRFEVLDSDNVGINNVNALSSGYNDTQKPLGFFGDYKGGGVWSNEGVTVNSSSGGSTVSTRGTEANSSININVDGNASGNVNVSHSHFAVIKLDRNDVPDNLYLTAYSGCLMSRVNPNYMAFSVQVVTVSGVYSGYVYQAQQALRNGRNVCDNLLPYSVGSDSLNIRYRWENSCDPVYGESVDLFSLEDGSGNTMQEYEKSAGFTVYVSNRVDMKEHTAPTIQMQFETKFFITSPVRYDGGNVVVSVSGRSDELGNPIVDTQEAYKSVLKLQNYSFYGIEKPSEGWGLGYPSGDLSNIIDPAITPRSIPLQYSTDSVNSRDVKYDLLKYTSGIGYIDRFGREAWADVLSMYVSDGVLFNKFKIQGSPEVENIDPTRVYPEIGVTYSSGAVSVGNVEQDTYSPDFVSGVEDKTLWLAGNVLYNRYKMKNEFPKKLGDISGIKNLSDAVEYVKNMYSLMGVVFGTDSVVLKRRHTVSFTTSAEYIHNTGLDLCSPIQFSYPNITTTPWTGMITGISKSIKKGTVDITAECVGDTIAESRAITITETGTTAYNIVEAGTTNHNIVEVF